MLRDADERSAHIGALPADQDVWTCVERKSTVRISGFQGGSSIYARSTTQRSSDFYQPPAPDDGARWATVLRHSSELAVHARDLERLLERRSASNRPGGIARVSGVVAGIDAPATASVLRSTERVNTETRTYDDSTPEWTGGSTQPLQIDGEWTGTGTETYTFTVVKVRNDTNQPSQVAIEDSQGNDLGRMNVRNSDEGTTWHAIGDTGLNIMFGVGDFELGDSFSLDVYEPRQIDVNTANPMDQPEIHGAPFETGQTVVDGSFFVNGTEISVSASESIDDVLARITALTSVTATFDASTQRVVLTHDTLGDEPIDLTGDTSGFLSATKLAGAAIEPGEDGSGQAGADQLLSELAAFSGVTAGSFFVNGTAIAVDPDADTLNDVLARIDAADADAVTSLSGTTVSIRHTTRGESLILDDNGTGFLSALGVDLGTTEAEGRGRGAKIGRQTAEEIAQLFADIGERLEALTSIGAETALLKGAIKGFASQTTSMFRAALDDGGTSSKVRAHGLRFEFDESAVSFGITSSDRRSMASALRRDYASFREAMLATSSTSEETFLGRLQRLAEDLARRANGQVDLRL